MPIVAASAKTFSISSQSPPDANPKFSCQKDKVAEPNSASSNNPPATTPTTTTTTTTTAMDTDKAAPAADQSAAPGGKPAATTPDKSVEDLQTQFDAITERKNKMMDDIRSKKIPFPAADEDVDSLPDDEEGKAKRKNFVNYMALDNKCSTLQNQILMAENKAAKASAEAAAAALEQANKEKESMKALGTGLASFDKMDEWYADQSAWDAGLTGKVKDIVAKMPGQDSAAIVQWLGNGIQCGKRRFRELKAGAGGSVKQSGDSRPSKSRKTTTDSDANSYLGSLAAQFGAAGSSSSKSSSTKSSSAPAAGDDDRDLDVDSVIDGSARHAMSSFEQNVGKDLLNGAWGNVEV